MSLLAWHPFSLTSAPNDVHDSVTVRELGGLTRRLRQYAARSNGQNMYVRVDGPYGHLPFDPCKESVSIYIAGGVGITPIIGILRHVFLSSSNSLYDEEAAVGPRRIGSTNATSSDWPTVSRDSTNNNSHSRIFVVWSVSNEVSKSKKKKCGHENF